MPRCADPPVVVSALGAESVLVVNRFARTAKPAWGAARECVVARESKLVKVVGSYKPRFCQRETVDRERGSVDTRHGAQRGGLGSSQGRRVVDDIPERCGGQGERSLNDGASKG